MSSLRSFRSPGWRIFAWLLRTLSAAPAAKKEGGGMWRTWSANICGCLFYGSLGLWGLEIRQGLDGPGGDTAIVVLRTRNDHPLAYFQISHTHRCVLLDDGGVCGMHLGVSVRGGDYQSVSLNRFDCAHDAATKPRTGWLPRLGRTLELASLAALTSELSLEEALARPALAHGRAGKEAPAGDQDRQNQDA
jgi:hypothetical protein